MSAHVPVQQQAAFGLLSVGADWDRIAGSPLGAQFFMTNALNKTYVASGFLLYSALGTDALAYGEPRMYGLRLRYQF